MTEAQIRPRVPEAPRREEGPAGLLAWVQRFVLWRRQEDLRRKPLRPSSCLSTDLPSAQEDGIIIFASDLGVPLVSFNGNWFPFAVNGAL